MGSQILSPWVLWAVRDDGPARFYFHSFRDRQRVFKFNALTPHCDMHFGVSEQELSRAYIAGLLVYLRDLGSAHRGGAVGGCF